MCLCMVCFFSRCCGRSSLSAHPIDRCLIRSLSPTFNQLARHLHTLAGPATDRFCNAYDIHDDWMDGCMHQGNAEGPERGEGGVSERGCSTVQSVLAHASRKCISFRPGPSVAERTHTDRPTYTVGLSAKIRHATPRHGRGPCFSFFL